MEYVCVHRVCHRKKTTSPKTLTQHSVYISLPEVGRVLCSYNLAYINTVLVGWDLQRLVRYKECELLHASQHTGLFVCTGTMYGSTHCRYDHAFKQAYPVLSRLSVQYAFSHWPIQADSGKSKEKIIAILCIIMHSGGMYNYR